MNDGAGDDEQPRSRRRRHDRDAPEGLSVADLLARHGVQHDQGAQHDRGVHDRGVPDEHGVPDDEGVSTSRHRLLDPAEPAGPREPNDEYDRYAEYDYPDDPVDPDERFLPPRPAGAPDPAGPPGSFEAFEPADSFDAFEPFEPFESAPPDRPIDRPRDQPAQWLQDRSGAERRPLDERPGPAGLFVPPGQDWPVRGGIDRPNLGPGRTEQIYRPEPPPPTNLFAQLGRAEPDDTPTDVVPRVADEPLAGEPDGVEVSAPRHAIREVDPDEPELDATGPEIDPSDAVSDVEPPDGARSHDHEPRHGTPPDDDAATAERPDDDAHPKPDAAEGFELRARQIDESLTRLTAIHAGMGKEMTERVSRTRGLPVVERTSEAEKPADEETDDEQPAGGWTRAGRVVALVAAVALFLGTAAGWGVQLGLNAKLRSVAALDTVSDAVVDPAAQVGDENFLVVGLDAGAPPPAPRSPAAGPNGLVTPVRSGGNSESVLVAHVPAARDRVVVVAFPGGLAIDRPSCDRWNQAAANYPGGTTPAQTGTRLASAYAVGGPRCVTKAIQGFTGLTVNHYAGVEFAGLKDMVDAVHGVPTCLTTLAPSADDAAASGSAPADAVLDGDQALAFVRASRPAGDPAAGAGQLQRQQLFFAALLRKATSDQVLTSFGQLSALVTAFGKHALNDNTGLDSLTTLAQTLATVDPEKVSFVTVPTYGQPDTVGNELPRADSTKALFDAIRADKPLPTDEGADAGPANPPATTVTLTVRNGSAKPGQANQVASSLRTLGFTVGAVRDAPPTPGGRTLIRHSPDRASQAASVLAAVPSGATEVEPGTTGLLELVLGDSFDGQVRAAPSGGGLHTLTAASTACN